MRLFTFFVHLNTTFVRRENTWHEKKNGAKLNFTQMSFMGGGAQFNNNPQFAKMVS